MSTHYKTVHRNHEPGHCHELTFTCYRGMPLLSTDERRRMLAQRVDRAMRGRDFRIVAFVFIPEHVHLLVYPFTPQLRLDLLLKAIKRPFSFRVKRALALGSADAVESEAGSSVARLGPGLSPQVSPGHRCALPSILHLNIN
jgi:putative transposase